MEDTIVSALSIYDRLNSYKLSPFRLKDSELKLAMNNLEQIPSLQQRREMQNLLNNEFRFRKLDQRIQKFTQKTNQRLVACQKKLQNQEQHLLRGENVFSKCFTWTLIIGGLLLAFIGAVVLIQVEPIKIIYQSQILYEASGTQTQIYGWLILVFGIIIFLAGIGKKCSTKQYKQKDYTQIQEIEKIQE